MTPETVKLLEENIGRKLSDINCSNIFFNLSLRIMEIKANKWDLLKLKSICTEKETINKQKYSLQNLPSFMMLNSIKTNNSLQKWAAELYRRFSKEDTDGQEAHEKMFNITNY